jgi:predicted ATPase
VVNLIQQNIANKAHELFMRYGFKAVTVDEIAKNAGISKKTLYENFSDKDEIVIQSVCLVESEMQEQEQFLAQNSSNAIEEAIGHMVMMEKMLKSMNVNCLNDLQKYYPAGFQHFETHKTKQMDSIINNLKRGIKEGYYRKGLDVNFCAWYRFENIMFMFQNIELNKRFNIVEAQIEMMQHFLFGISTLKGHELIQESIQKLKKKK